MPYSRQNEKKILSNKHWEKWTNSRARNGVVPETMCGISRCYRARFVFHFWSLILALGSSVSKSIPKASSLVFDRFPVGSFKVSSWHPCLLWGFFLHLINLESCLNIHRIFSCQLWHALLLLFHTGIVPHDMSPSLSNGVFPEFVQLLSSPDFVFALTSLSSLGYRNLLGMYSIADTDSRSSFP